MEMPRAQLPEAFTLIELPVVIAIIAILIALLFPATNNATAAARVVQCLDKMRSLAVANLQYANAHGGILCNTAAYFNGGLPGFAGHVMNGGEVNI